MTMPIGPYRATVLTLALALLLATRLTVPPALAQDAPDGDAATPLVPGQVRSDSLAATDVHTYSIDLPAHQFVYGEADQQTVDVVVTVYAPDGGVVHQFDGPARGPETFQFDTDVAGRYRIEVKPFEQAEGRYTIAIERVEPVATEPARRVDQLMAAYDGTDVPGGVVAVVRDGEITFARGYGMANLEYGVPNTPETAFHVASVSKQFTAFAIAMLAEWGKLGLDDDVRTYVPEVPDFGKTVTLRHLLTHTGGLRDQWDLWAMSGGRMDDVIRQVDLMALVERQRELNFEPGAEFLYSNTGYMLLAEVVERVTGEDFGAWMREHVFAPLDMRSTQVYDDHERLVTGRAYSYRIGEQGLEKAVLSYANAGATSLFTTAEDLAKWLRNLHTAEIGGRGVVERMQERGVLTTGDTLGYALGLAIGPYRGLRRIQHGGADAGYRTMLAYYPEIEAGIIVLSNLASFQVGRIATEVAEAFFGDAMAPEEVKPDPVRDASVTVAPDRLDAYAGQYRIEGGPVVRFTRERDRFVTQIEGQPRYFLVPLADTLFRVDVPHADARVSFHVEPDGRVEHGTIHQNGHRAMHRIAPWQPDARALAAYEGRYYSPELETFYTVAVRDSHLVAQHRRHGEIVLTPAEKDSFRGSEWFFGEVTFERGDASTVAGMRVSSGRVRNLRFEKQE